MQGAAAGRTGLAKARLALLAGGGLGLLGGLWTGLARAGLPVGDGPAAHHGLLMTFGFLGTLVALERAVAHRRWWAYLAPASSGLAALLLLAGGPVVVSGVLLVVAGVLVTVVYVQNGLTLGRFEPYLVLMGAGAVAWVVAAVAWTTGASPVRLGPLLAAFLVLTILGERLELSRLRQPGRAAIVRVLTTLAVFVAGVGLSWFDRGAGLVVAGVALVATTAWFVRNDVARVTIRRDGLPRFAAACMLAGYAWLAIGGVLWVVLGLGLGGALVHDAAVHAVFLGFVLSMVMGHAPIILPAVLRIQLPYRRVAWLPLALLHLTVSVRVIADLAGSTWGRSVGAAANVAVLLLFVAVTVTTAARASSTTWQPDLTPLTHRP